MTKYNLSAKVGEYTDKQGNNKARYATIGTLVVTDDGKVYGNIDLIPTNFNGHFNAFKQEDKQ